VGLGTGFAKKHSHGIKLTAFATSSYSDTRDAILLSKSARHNFRTSQNSRTGRKEEEEQIAVSDEQVFFSRSLAQAYYFLIIYDKLMAA
jgi:hypothetical protein